MAQTPEQRRDRAKRTRLMTLYCITPEEEIVVEEFQRGAYGPYGLLLQKGDISTKARLYNDHNHVSGLYRGRLSYLINKGLGIIEGTYKERTPAILRALAYYLDYPPAPIALHGDRYGLIGRAKLNKKVKIYGSENGPIQPAKKGKS
jgi:hypothetical protein